MRLIDADVLKQDINKVSTHWLNEWSTLGVLAMVDKQPSCDAVPVVRCKDCKHRPTKPDDYNPITTDGFALEFPDEKCPCQCGDGWYSKYPDDDWYCPIGERKGGDE